MGIEPLFPQSSHTCGFSGTLLATLPDTASLALWLGRPSHEWKIQGLNPTCAGIFLGSSHISDLKFGTPAAIPCQAPGIIGSVLGLAGPVSVYCDWVRWKVWSVTSISVWQHVKLSEQICPWGTLACCWDVKQATKNNNPARHVALQGQCWY